MRADVALAHRAQERVDQSVEQHVGVRMAGEACGVGNLDAAENELSPALKAMDVEAVADAKITSHEVAQSGVARSSRDPK
jgi:hypothetical protein